MSEQAGGGRYQRSVGGLIGAMLVCLVVVVGFLAFREVFREDLEVAPEPIDYLAAVEQAHRSGQQPVHPPRLPAGWQATSVGLASDEQSSWALGVLTAESDFVGLQQADESPEDMLAELVAESPVQQGTVRTPDSVAPRWTVWADEGGDRAYVAEVGEDTVVVYGSAGAEAMEAYLSILTR